MRVFITGVSGFIGSGLVDYLQSVKELVLFGHSRNIKSASQKFKDLRVKLVPDYSSKTLDDLNIDCVIHLAGIAHDLNNKYRWDDYCKVNFEGTVSVFNDFINSRATRFIFLSSIKAVVDSSSEPVAEDAAPHPISDYGKSKRMAEEYIQKAKLAEGKHAYIFRPAMVHGKGNKGNLNILYKYVRSGLPYIFGAYTNSRSFLSAQNLHFVLHRFLQKDYASGIYHIADDEALSTTELIRIISSGLGRKPRIWNLPIGIMDPLSKMASWFQIPSEKMKRKLTESLIVSNNKLKSVLGEKLPVDAQTGLMNTLRSFHEQ